MLVSHVFQNLTVCTVYEISTQISIVAFLARADAPEIDTRCNRELHYAD
jgi:hypothetical protein